MRKFDVSASCPKCNFNGSISYHWHAKASKSRLRRILEGTFDFFSVPVGVPLRRVREEHMARLCPMCKYAWAELPIDIASPLVQLALQAD